MTSCSLRIPIRGAVVLKDPDARKDYTVDYEEWLTNPETGVLFDTVANAEFTVSGTGIAPDLNIFVQAFNDTSATVWLAGGYAGSVYTVHCRVTTAGGRIDDDSFKVRVEEK